MSESDGIGSPGRQKRSTERSRENIRGYVKLLGKKVSDSSPGRKSPQLVREEKSPMGGSPSKMFQEEEGSDSSPGSGRKKDLLIVEEAEGNAKGLGSSSPKAKRSLLSATKGLEKDTDKSSQGAMKELSVPLLEKDGNKCEEKDHQTTSKSREENQESKKPSDKDELSKESSDSSGGLNEKGSKAQKTVRRASSDSKRTPVKVDKNEDSSDDSPPDLILFLKEGRARTQSWSEPPTLDAESIATRSRTRVPTDLNLKIPRKLKLGENVKLKGKEVPKKDAKRDKSKVLETPESLKRLAQTIPAKDPKRSSTSQDWETSRNISIGKGKTKVALTKDIGSGKSKTEDTQNSSEDKNKFKPRKRIVRDGNVSSSPDNSGCDQVADVSSSKSEEQNDKKGEEKTGASKRVLQMSKNLSEEVKIVQKEGTIKTLLVVTKTERSKNLNSDKIPSVSSIPSKKEEVKVSISSIVKGQEEKKSESRIVRFISKSLSGKKILGEKTSKPFSSVASETNKDIENNDNKKSNVVTEKTDTADGRKSNVTEKTDTASSKKSNDIVPEKADSTKPKCSENIGKEQEVKLGEIRVTRSIVKPAASGKVCGMASSEDAQGIQSTVSSGLSAEAKSSCSNVAVVKKQEKPSPLKPSPLKVSNLVTIAAANPGNGAPVRYRKIHIKIPNLQQTPTSKVESPVFIGDTEVIAYRSDSSASPLCKTSKEDKGKGTPEKTPEREDEQSDTDYTLMLSPTPHKVALYDFTDIEAEEVVVGDGKSSSEVLPGSGREADSIMEQVPQQQLPDMNLLSSEVLDSSSEDDSAKGAESSSSSKKQLLLSPEGKVALDHSYSSGNSEESKGSSSHKKRSTSHEKTLSPRPVYSSASLAKRSLDIMMHNDKINILRQMSQIFNNEKPSGESEESEEDVRRDGNDPKVGIKNKGVGKGEKIKNKNVKKNHDKQLGDKPNASYVLTPEKTLKSPRKMIMVEPSQKVLMVEPMPSHVKDLQKDFDRTSSKSSDITKNEMVKLDREKFSVKQIKDQGFAKKDEGKDVVEDIGKKEGSKQGKVQCGTMEMENVTNLKEHQDSSKKDRAKPKESQETFEKEKIVCDKTQDSSKKDNVKHDEIHESSEKDIQELIKKDKLKQDKIKDSFKKDAVKQCNIQELSKKDEVEQDEAIDMLPKLIAKQSDMQNLSEKDCVKQDDEQKNVQYSKVQRTPERDDGQDDSLQETFDSVHHISDDETETKETKVTEGSSKPKRAIFYSPSKDEPFIGFPDTVAKVHHVSSYAASPDENIQIESRLGSKGEAIDVIDGFTFISFNTEEEMVIYSRMECNKSQRKFRRLRKKKGKARKFSRIKKHNFPLQRPSSSQMMAPPRREHHGFPDDSSIGQSGAFASNDLDAFLDNCSRLNISYAIPKCKATEAGVTKMSDQVLADEKPDVSPRRLVSPLEENQTDTSFEDPNVNGQTDDNIVSDPIQPYEEVNAIDILYPKEKYKYYYNKDLCKDTKADGSNVFVRRAGKLVPLTSVFKSQKSSTSVTVAKKTVELVYVYDGGKLLTLGGSLTKINPSNSDSVRARVVLPMGTPLIARGEAVDSSKKQVQAVEINEDMAKFALSALQDPFAKENEDKENSTKILSSETCTGPVETPVEKETSKEKVQDKKPAKKWPNVSVKPTKTNILDIIAAKLAMSEDESDEKEEEETPLKGKEIADKKIGTKSDEKEKKDVSVDGKECKSLSIEEAKDDGENRLEDGTKSTDNLRDKSTSDSVGMEKSPVDGNLPDAKKSDFETEKEVRKCPWKSGDMNLEKEQIGNVLKNEDDDIDAKEDGDETKEMAGVASKGKKEAVEFDSANNEKKKEKVQVGLNCLKDEKIVKEDKEDKTEITVTQKERENEQDDKEDQNAVVLPKDNKEENAKMDVKCPSKGDSDLKEVSEKKDEDASMASSFNTTLEECGTGEKESQKVKPDTGGSSVTSKSQNDAREEPIERKDEKSKSETTDSFEKISTAIKVKPNKAKVFKKNMYRFPSLSREMKRLNMNFVNYNVGEASEEKSEVEKSDEKVTCTNDFCKLGCICDTLSCPRRDPDHCGRIECMFECTCRDGSWKHPVSGSGRTMNAVSIFNLDREQMEGLAVREKDFKRTVIQTGSEVILVGAEKKKREIRIPGRYRDSAMLAGNDYIAMDTAEAEPSLVKEESRGIPLSEAQKYIKKCSVNVPWYDIKGISIWCMDHSCYDCKCFTDISYRTPADEESLHSLTVAEMLKPDTKPDFDQSVLTKVKEEKSLEPSCVIVNIDVNNIQARRRYCWRLKEWYHPVDLHCSRTCGYSSSKKRLREETKQMTITGQASQDDSPEQLVENVVRSLRYEKSKEYCNGAVSKYFESVGGASPTKLKKIMHLQSKTNPENSVKSEKSEVLPESVPVVDLTSEIIEDSKDCSDMLSRTLKTLSKSEEAPKAQSLLSEEKDSVMTKKRKFTEPADVNGSAEKLKSAEKLNKTDSSVKKDLQPSKLQESSDSNIVFVSEQSEEEKKSLVAIDIEPISKDKEDIKVNEEGSLRKPLSLIEMMVAEEKRGELELDLSYRTPGNALLVAEGRFRKLINMNIIGVIGINKAGRCIISTVDSAVCLRTMQRIHTMISNNALDVGPNMREIFFPPAHAAPRPRVLLGAKGMESKQRNGPRSAPLQRFVMIRCDSVKKWEIVGVVQKKGPLASSKKSLEQKNKSGQPQKAASAQPQIIDLEEEDRNFEKTDIIEISPKEISPLDEFESCIEKGSSSWEGSFPQIESVQGGSDVVATEIEESSKTVEVEPIGELLTTSRNSEPGVNANTSALLPNLIPLSCTPEQQSEEKESLPDKKIVKASVPSNITSPIIPGLDNAEKLSSNVISGVPNPVTGSQQLYFLPTAYSSTSTVITPSISPAPIASVPGMRMIRLNQTSGRVFGENSGNFLPLSSIACQSPHPSGSGGASPLYAAASPLLPQLIPGTSSHSALISSPGFETVLVNPAKDAGAQCSGLLPQQIGGSTTFRPVPFQKPLEGNVPSTTANTGATQKTFYLPSSSGGIPKMVLVPTSKSGTSQMVVMPSVSKSQDVPLKKMLLVPSTSESGKMVLIPMPSTVGNEPTAIGGDDVAGIARFSGANQPLLATSNLKSSSSVEQAAGSEVQILSTKHLTPPANRVPDSIREKNKDTASDDVVVLGSPLNSLTISRVRSSSESKGSGQCSSSSLVAVSSSGSSSSTTISSTLPQVAPSSNFVDVSDPAVLATTAIGQVVDTQSLLIKPSSDKDGSMQQKPQMVKSVEADSSGTSNDNPIIEYETIKSPEKGSQKSECALRRSPKKEAKEAIGSIGSSDEIQEVTASGPQIKKGGYHWSAVDLSLSFKSVKLEWLLGTIRKNVLVNIYRMSLKTQSPVTLSVKNGTSMSMLYGLARKSYYDIAEEKCLPVLILGSVMSAVMSSAATEDSLLFKANAIKYFIREVTGELASYTYDDNGCNLIKLASKKRGATGEMIGIGETISLHSVRDTKYLEGGQTTVAKKCVDDDIKVSQGSECSCITAGNFICLGHKSTAVDEQPSSSTSVLNHDIPLPTVDAESPSKMVTKYIQLKDPLKIHADDQGTNNGVKQMKSDGIPRVEKDMSCDNGESFQNSLDKKDIPISSVLKPSTSSNPDCEIVCVKNTKIASSPSEVIQLAQELLHKEGKSKDQPTGEKEELIDIEGYCDEGSIITNLRDQMVVLNKTMGVGKTGKIKKSSGPLEVIEQVLDLHMPPPQNVSPQLPTAGVVVRNISVQFPTTSVVSNVSPLLPTSGVVNIQNPAVSVAGLKISKKRKQDHAYDRPCPLSKKQIKERTPQVKQSSTLFPAKIKETESSCSRTPLHLAHLKSTPIQESFSGGGGGVEVSDEILAGPSGLGGNQKSKSALRLGNPVQRIQKRELKYVDIEGLEERSSFVHNELERMRRKALRHLFLNLGSAVSQSETESSMADYKAQPKIFILRKASELSLALQTEAGELEQLEMQQRKERSKLIRRLAKTIGDKGDDVKKTWKTWVQENMQNPTAKEIFEKNWQPVDMDKEIMALSSNESSLDIDTDDGSPLSAPSSPVPDAWIAHPQSSTQTSGQSTVAPIPTLKTTQLAKQTSLGSTSSPTFDFGTYSTTTASSSIIDKSKLGDQSLERREFPKPPYSYSCLIALAIKNSNGGTLHVSEIYKFMRSFFPYFRVAPRVWKNAVRHCLSLNKCFEKIEVPHVGGRKYHLWTLNEEHSPRLKIALQRWHDRNMEEILNSMEYPEFLSLLQKGVLKVEYSSSEDEDDDTITTVNIPESRIRALRDSHTTIPVVVLKKQDASSSNIKQDGCPPNINLSTKETHMPQNQSSITCVVTAPLDKSNTVTILDDPEIICLE